MPQASLPDAVSWLSAFGPLIVSVGVGYVAWQQWQTARHKLKLDLFDRRLRVYQATKDLVNTMMLHGRISDEELGRFYADIRGAEFLFDSDLRSYYTKIGDMVWRTSRLASTNSIDLRSGNRRDERLKEEDQLYDYLQSEYRRLDERFRSALDLSSI